MLSIVYAQKVLCNDLSIKFAADVLNGHVNIWDETCTAINGWCSNEAVYKTWDAMGAAWVFVYLGMLMGW